MRPFADEPLDYFDLGDALTYMIEQSVLDSVSDQEASKLVSSARKFPTT